MRNQNPLVFTPAIDANALHEDWQGNFQSFLSWATSQPADTGCSDTTNYSACALWIEISGGDLVKVYDPLPEWAGAGRNG